MKFGASISNRKSPVDRLAFAVPLGDVGIDASLQGCFIRNATGKACTRQNGEFHLSHIEPTAMLRRVVEFQLSGDGAGLLWWKRLVERSRLVRVEIVQHHANRSEERRVGKECRS